MHFLTVPEALFSPIAQIFESNLHLRIEGTHMKVPAIHFIPVERALSASVALNSCDDYTSRTDLDVAIADGPPNFLVDRPCRLPHRQLSRSSQDHRGRGSRGAQSPPC